MTQGDPIPPPPPNDPFASPTGTPPLGATGPSPAPGYVAPGAPVGGTPVPYQSAVGHIETNPEAKQWGMFAHLSSLAGFIIPFGNFVGPLVVWLMKKDTMPFVDDQGKESMNFQITVLIAAIIAGATICIGIGFILLPLVGIAAAIMSILAGIKANEGVAYRYPFTLRLIK
jgi:uncharacterized Tic20 family protein